MSESSSSPSANTGGAGGADPFSFGTTAADAPPAIAKVIPAAPHAGKDFIEPFRFGACFFARAIIESPVPAGKWPTGHPIHV